MEPSTPASSIPLSDFVKVLGHYHDPSREHPYYHLPAREAVYVVSVKGGLARIVDDKSMHVRSVAWANVGTPFVANGASDPPAPLLYPQPPAVNAAALIPMKDVYLAPSYG